MGDLSEEKGFESSLQELEDRVRQLESGQLPLDRALRLFEEGVSIARVCHEQLGAAEQRISQLSRGTEGIDESPLDEPS